MNQVIIFSLVGFAVVAALVVLCFILFNYFRQQMTAEFKQHQEQFMQLAQKQFLSEQGKASSELEKNKQAVENSVRGLKDELERYQKIIHEHEQDRSKKYGSLEEQLRSASLATVGLQETTNRLNNILGNVKLRGQWGERMAEDIIRYAGLVEGVNYIKQTQLESTTTKPDYTFFLPNDHKVNMDVKFPLDNYLNFVNATETSEQERFEKDFIRNVKGRIKEIQNRDYINPADSTLDFVILFIPNEQVFGVIHDKMPDLVDETLKQKVVLCSPFTLYAVLSIIRQSHENFRYEKDMKKIMQLMDQFAKLYTKFKGRFDDIGKTIDKLSGTYNDVRDKSFKGLDTKIRHIDDYKKGKGISFDKDNEVLLDENTAELEDQETVV